MSMMRSIYRGIIGQLERRIRSVRGATAYLEYFIAASAMAGAAMWLYTTQMADPDPDNPKVMSLLETHFHEIYCDQVNTLVGEDPCN